MYGNRLELRFRPGDPSGFTPAGIAGFSNLKPAAIVRELVQNSLDAANEAGKSPAHVRFRLTQCSTNRIPGICEYRKAFKAAVATHENGGKLPSQATRVVNAMQEALKRDKQDLLAVIDNGIGLNERSMHALLSDGISVKGGTASGTFGNGHSVVIPASDLRYILYGGITREGSEIGAGHAVIASWEDGNQLHQRSGNGYLVEDFASGSYVYARNHSLPNLIRGHLRDVRETSQHGTVVIIPAFNHFRQAQEKPLWEVVSQAVACNFFQAIAEDKLVVDVEDLRQEKPRSSMRVDHARLPRILKDNRSQKRSKGFLSGQKAYNAYNAFRLGVRHEIQTHLGNIRVLLHEVNSGKPRVDLCRNGMWITDGNNLPHFYYTFSDQKPFHALLLLDSQSGSQLHELVRNAEGPLHDKLDVTQRLNPSEAKKLRSAFKQIRDNLKSLVPKITSDPYAPDDFLTLDFGDGKGKGKSQPSYWGIPGVVSRRPRSPRLGGVGTRGSRSNGGSGNKARPRLQPDFRVASVPRGDDRRRIILDCQRDCENTELRLRIDENLDETCDPQRAREIGVVTIRDARVGGKPVNGNQLVSERGRTIGLRLGQVASGTTLDIDVSYDSPIGKLLLTARKAAIRVEIFEVPSTAVPESVK